MGILTEIRFLTGVKFFAGPSGRAACCHLHASPVGSNPAGGVDVSVMIVLPCQVELSATG